MTSSELIKKVEQKAKEIRFKAIRNYHQTNRSSYPYEEVIVMSDEYPKFVFFVQKNAIFERNSISDSSYDVFSFDMDGNFVRKESVEELGHDFFKNMKVLKKI